MKKILAGALLIAGGALPVAACTGISSMARDGGYVQARTIEWGESRLPSEYVVIPRGHETVSYTPTGVNGVRFKAKYGVVGLAIVRREFVAEGLNEAACLPGCFISLVTASMKLMMPRKTRVRLPTCSWCLGCFRSLPP